MNHKRDWAFIMLCLFTAIALLVLCNELAPYLPGGK